jgi:hypothetical protein
VMHVQFMELSKYSNTVCTTESFMPCWSIIPVFMRFMFCFSFLFVHLVISWVTKEIIIYTYICKRPLSYQSEGGGIDPQWWRRFFP